MRRLIRRQLAGCRALDKCRLLFRRFYNNTIKQKGKKKNNRKNKKTSAGSTEVRQEQGCSARGAGGAALGAGTLLAALLLAMLRGQILPGPWAGGTQRARCPPGGELAAILGSGSAAGAGAINQRRKSVRPPRARLVPWMGKVNSRALFWGKFFHHELHRQRICASHPGFAHTWPDAARQRPQRSIAASSHRSRSARPEPAPQPARVESRSCSPLLPRSHRCKPIRAL